MTEAGHGPSAYMGFRERGPRELGVGKALNIKQGCGEHRNEHCEAPF